MTLTYALLFLLAAVDSDPAASTMDRARALADRFILVDGHIDVPYRLEESQTSDGKLTENILQRTDKGNFDVPRAKQGGLDVPFFSIYVPAKYQKEGGAKRLADKLIDRVTQIVQQAPGTLTLATDVEHVKRAVGKGEIAVALGMENGAPLEGTLANVGYFHARGIRYITLTHSKDNDIADSSYDTARTWRGLSPFGKKVVAEMNRVGIMIDISHLSDAAASQALELSRVPVIASHSSCRHFTPGWERNISDDLIRAVASKGGVVQINFGSSFLSKRSRQRENERRAVIKDYMKANKLADDHPKALAFAAEQARLLPTVFASVEDVADHIDHVVRLVGIDHVGLGSDFDGVDDTLPTGLKDVSQYPNLLRVLLERGYAEADIEKICGTNVLRVWSAVEAFAAAGKTRRVK